MLSSRQLRQLRWAFNVLDEDGSGTLEGAELEGLIQLLGDNPTQAEAKELLAWIDQDGDGVISFEEFARAWWMRPTALVEAEEGHDELELAFRIFDADEDGRVSAEELTEVFTKMGERLSDEEMDEFLGWLGLRDGGSINLVNFKKLPCWQPEEAATAGAPKKGGMLSHFSQKRENPMGTVSVRVVRGTGLLAADSGGTSDPYVLVSLWSPYDGGNSARSSAKKKTLNPVWEETLSTLSVYDQFDRCVISFSVWDHDNLSINDDLGSGEALLRNCTPGVATPLTIPLSTQGSIEVEVTFTLAPKPEPTGDAPETYEEKLQKKEREQAARAKERLNARGSVVADLDDIALWPKSDC
jgi:calmodulin